MGMRPLWPLTHRFLSKAAQCGPGSARAAQQTHICSAQRQPCVPAWSSSCSSPGPAAGRGQPAAPHQGFLPLPAHPDASPEERNSGQLGSPHREESRLQAGEKQAEGRLRADPAAPRQVTHGQLRGLFPFAPPEARCVRQERLEASRIHGQHGEREGAAEEKGVGDEGSDVSGVMLRRAGTEPGCGAGELLWGRAGGAHRHPKPSVGSHRHPKPSVGSHRHPKPSVGSLLLCVFGVGFPVGRRWWKWSQWCPAVPNGPQ
ncbi:uncharacterized protein LOC116241203 isoform X2 [Phasianus colchicus]|uniref:uncharacterized protein LOC116241203 isoform X2 n=1 Tax=Phasianus colchicus TaxID=9054 RepID=UPI00129E58F2|nr:uncharacterized protein LOC116241203 isoform X2 [Phasianus colchicus]